MSLFLCHEKRCCLISNTKYYRTSFERPFCHESGASYYTIVEGGIIMKENDMTPIITYNDALVYEEFKKEDLDEAGVVIDYVDDEFIDVSVKRTKRQQRGFSQLMFLFLVFSFLVIVYVGSVCILNSSDNISMVDSFFQTSEIVKERI